jgi:hypothetical protein
VNRTWELGKALLAVMEEAYNNDPAQKPRLPKRRFVYAGSVAYDVDDSMFVTWTGGLGSSGDPSGSVANQRVLQYAARSATYLVGVTRCAPTVYDAGARFYAPKAADLETTGERVTDDEALVRKAIIEGHLNGKRFGEGPVLAIGAVSAIPSSTVTGFTMVVTIGLSG